MYNNGLLVGTGRVQAQLLNNPTGEVRVGALDQLRFESSGNSNDGQINLLGGVMVIEGTFDVLNGQNAIRSVAIAAPAEVIQEVPAGPLMEGTVVRVVEPDNQLIVRTPTGEEVALNTDERTTVILDNRPGRLVRSTCWARRRRSGPRSWAGSGSASSKSSPRRRRSGGRWPSWNAPRGAPTRIAACG